MTIYWQDVEEGAEIPAFSRTTTLDELESVGVSER